MPAQKPPRPLLASSSNDSNELSILSIFFSSAATVAISLPYSIGSKSMTHPYGFVVVSAIGSGIGSDCSGTGTTGSTTGLAALAFLAGLTAGSAGLTG